MVMAVARFTIIHAIYKFSTSQFILFMSIHSNGSYVYNFSIWKGLW